MTFPYVAGFTYQRTGDTLHIKTKELTNHEMRAILIGFWLTLDVDDRVDHIAELQAYLDPNETPPSASTTIAYAIMQARAEEL